MSLRKTLGFSLALLVMSTAAFAKTAEIAHPTKPHSIKAPDAKARTTRARTTKTRSKIRTGKTRSAKAAGARLFSTKVFGAKAFTLATVRVSAVLDAPRAEEHATAVHPAKTVRLASARDKRRLPVELARRPAEKVHKPVEHGRRLARLERTRPVAAGRERRAALDRRRPLVRDALFEDRHDVGRSIMHDADYSPVQPVDRLLADGPRQVGNAAWYGGDRIGRPTASGTPLDTIHATAAHRSLPLNSLARVTNLRNGRSVVVTINDRGPASRGFIIDMSPKAAEDLGMVHSGVAPVSVVPVVEQSASLR